MSKYIMPFLNSIWTELNRIESIRLESDPILKFQKECRIESIVRLIKWIESIKIF
jgi:hypothetical protein